MKKSVTAYFDCQFGAAGDMLLGALIDAGLDFDIWKKELQKIALPENSFLVRMERVVRCSLSATKLDVDIAQNGMSFSAKHAPEHTHGHEHLHSSVQLIPERQPEHNPTFPNDHAENHDHGRKLIEVLEIIAGSSVSLKAKTLASNIFTRLARAEGSVHGISPESVHFHEVGAVDAIVDIVGFAIAYDLMGIENSFVSKVPLGSGHIKMAHGIFPVPGPAVVTLLKEVSAPTSGLNIPYECLTPTGAAILCEVASRWGEQPAFEVITHTGYGAGTKDTPVLPNVCRILLGQEYKSPALQIGYNQEIIVEIAANIDDMSPHLLAHIQDLLLAEGALDISVVPAVMKKNRAGHILSVLCRPQDEGRLKELILTETSSLGVRSHSLSRLSADREWQNIEMENGAIIRIKLARDKSGKLINSQPEYEDCASYSRESGVPIKEVVSRAIALFQNRHRS